MLLAGVVRHQKICHNCGRPFVDMSPSRNRKHCTNKCRSLYMWRRERERHALVQKPKHLCALCSRPFYSNHRGRKYCGHDCYLRNNRINDRIGRGFDHKRRACACGCGVTFKILNSRNRFATQACKSRQGRRDQYAKEKVLRLCKTVCGNVRCGKAFFTTKTNVRFCCKECARQDNLRRHREKHWRDKAEREARA